MPMIPELPVALLACARIGAVHSVIFGGFSARAIRDRAEDAESHVIVTADGGYRRGSVLPLKKIVDEAIADLDVVRHVVVFKRAGVEVSMREGRDHWWHELMAKADAECEPEAMDATDPLFILYTSGTTGKPKGIQHSTGGYLVGVATTTKYVFDLKDEDLFWCTADIGWVTGHSYIVYGPLANGASVFMYEGAPDWPEPDRFWRMIEEYDITILYTAPTAIRAFMRWGDEYPKRHDLSSLRLLGTVGEPINPEAWRWYRKTIGGGRGPIGGAGGQAETGKVAEAAVVGKPHPVKGQSLVAYVVLKRGEIRSDGLKKDLQKHVREAIGAIAVPDDVYITEKLPKTRSGKIMRRVIRSLVSGQEIGDTTTLEDPGAVDEVRKWLAEVEAHSE